MTTSYLRNTLFVLNLLTVFGTSNGQLNLTGETITTRYWDCCKPSCSWVGKGDFNTHPVQTCDKGGNQIPDFAAGTACGVGGTAYTCSNQQPWKVNDTFAYGYAGVYLLGHPKTETDWCCSCFQLTFTSGSVKGKTMVVQASNTAFDITTSNRFSIAMPGGNTTSHDACAQKYGVEQSVFGQEDTGVSSSDDCNNLPSELQDACRFRFDWFKDDEYPSANFLRVPCPSVLTDKTGCIRKDEKLLAAGLSSASTISPTSSWLAGLAMTMITAILLSA